MQSIPRKWQRSAQLEFLEKFAKDHKIRQPEEWGKVTKQDLVREGAGFIGTQFGNSLYKALRTNYPDLNWKKEWFKNLKNVPVGYWKEEENHRRFLLEFASKKSIESPSDWGKVSNSDLIKENGATILRIHGNSILTMLRKIFPETSWKEEWFPNSHLNPRKFWKSQENHKKMFLKLEKEFNIKHPSDWGKITTEKIRKHREASSVLHFYRYSLIRALKYVFPETEWKREWFVHADRNPSGHWTLEAQRTFLTSAGKTLGVKEPKDWGLIKAKQLLALGGKAVLSTGASLYEVLRNTFPVSSKETTWKEEWFVRMNMNPKGFWLNRENAKSFMEKIAKTLGVQKPSDWGRVTLDQLRKHGGASVLSVYRGSLFRIVRNVYKEWFRTPVRRFPANYFENLNNQRAFFESLASQYHLKAPADWKAVSSALIRKRGGAPLLARYNNSLLNALRATFPHKDWSKPKVWICNGKLTKQSLSAQHKTADTILQQWIVYK